MKRRKTCFFFLTIAALLCFATQRSNTYALDIFELRDSLVDDKALNFSVSATTNFGTNVNGKTHQQWPMQTFKGYQYATYYDHNRNVCLARRKLPAGDWDVIRFTDYQILSNDSHNVTVVGICEGDGSIHLLFNHHADQINYRYTAPGVASDPESTEWNASLFSDVVHELGPVGHIDRFTYPRFFQTPSGNLMLYYRYFTSGNGDSVIREYDATAHQWRTDLGKFIARDIGAFSWNGAVSNFRYAYINAIDYAADRIHVSWLWRDRFEKTSADNNHDVCYAYSDDDGRTWKNSAGEQIAVTGSSFISIDSPGITVGTVNPEQNLINQNTHYAYSDGTVHIMMRHNVSGTTDVKYHHYWRDIEGNWQSQALAFSGSRPSLVGDPNKNLLLVYTSGGRTRIAHGVPNETNTAWTWSSIFTQSEFTDGGEGVIDFSRWQKEQILSTYSQEKSPDSNETPTPLRVIDYKLTDKLTINTEPSSDPNTLTLSWIFSKHSLQKQVDQLDPDAWEYQAENIRSPLILTLNETAQPTFYRLATPPPPAVFRRFDWDDGTEDVFLKDLDQSVSDGIFTLTFSAANADPYIRMNEGSVNADEYAHVRLRVRNQTSGTNWRLYFQPDGGSEGGNSVAFSPTANSDWETIEIDMTADPDWQGPIDSIRVDFGDAVDGTVQFDYIEIYK